jgi:hypothetical protein
VISCGVFTMRLDVHEYWNIFNVSRAEDKMKVQESVNASNLNSMYSHPAPRISRHRTQALDTHESTPCTSTTAKVPVYNLLLPAKCQDTIILNASNSDTEIAVRFLTRINFWTRGVQ